MDTSEYEDVLGNGTLLKKVVSPGTGVNPVIGQQVTTIIKRTIPELNKALPDTESQWILGECEVEQAIDLVVALMKEGEEARVVAGFRFMYGELGLEPDIPAKANFLLDIKLLKIDGIPDYNSLGIDERFSLAKKKKDRGNYFYRRKEYSQAIFVYSKANKIVDPTEGFVYPDASPSTLQELLEFRGVVLSNISVAQLKVGSADAAVKSALEATQLCPTYSKAYFRLGQAYEGLGKMDEAIKAHKLALKNDPDNSKIIHMELSRLTKLNKEAKQSQRDMYSKMFWGSNPPDMNKSNKTKAASETSQNISWYKNAFLWGTIGAGVAGAASLGLYRYFNSH